MERVLSNASPPYGRDAGVNYSRMSFRPIAIGGAVAFITGAAIFLYYRDLRELVPSFSFGERQEQKPIPQGEQRTADDASSSAAKKVSDDTVLGTPVSEEMIAEALAQWQELRPASAQAASEPIRFWFASASELYIEYGQSPQKPAEGMLFLSIAKQANGRLHFTKQSAYIFGETDWILKEGKEVRYTKPQGDLYEKDRAGKWVKVN